MKHVVMAVAAVLVFAVVPAVAGELTFKRGGEDTRPEIFRNADRRDALMAEEVARLDAWAKLAEMIEGMEISGATSVRDMVDAAANLQGAIQGTLRGMRERETTYYDNGIVQIKVEVVWRELVERVEAYLKERQGEDGFDAEAFVKYNSENRDTVLEVWGAGALAGSEGVEIIKALRAAEVAASAQMVAKLSGVEIFRNTTVNDFALASDEIRSCINDVAKNIKYVDYRILDDTVEVDAQVDYQTTIPRIERACIEVVRYDRCGSCPTISAEYRDVTVYDTETTTFSATGKAIIREDGTVTVETAAVMEEIPTDSPTPPSPEKTVEVKAVLERTVAKGIVVAP